MNNKTLFLLFLTLATFSYPTNAQLLKGYGVKLALTSATQSFAYSNTPFPVSGPDIKRRLGFGVAAYAEWFNNPIFSVLSQVEYIQRGIGEKITVTGEQGPTPIGTEVRDKRLDYLSILIPAKATLAPGIVSPYIFAGPRADFLLGYHDEFFVRQSIYQDFKKTMLGGSFGAGVEITGPLPNAVSLEFLYNIDFSNSYDTSLLKIRNSAYDIWVGIGI